VLITGGAGFLGINLVRHLLDRGVRTVRTLDVEEFSYPERERVDAITGSVSDAAAVAKAVQGMDVVVHAAAALPLYSAEEIMRTNAEGTGIVLEEAARAGVTRVIFISSTAVYGIPSHTPLLESDPIYGVGPYGHAKIQAEQMCDEYRSRGMVVPVIRPKSFVGPERLGAFELLYRWASEGHGFPVIGNGRNRYQLLDVEDLCEAIALCATAPPESCNTTFNIGAAEFGSIRDDFQAVLDEAGFGKKIVPFPKAIAIPALRTLEMLHLSPVYKWIYETAGKESWVSIEKAKELLGFVPRHSNRDALLRNYHWYLQNRQDAEAPAGVSHRVPWKSGILDLIKRVF
jgi:nucleoside-diphosphate-sugar epimerase